MTQLAKLALLKNRKEVLANRGKDNAGVIKKINRQIRNMQ